MTAVASPRRTPSPADVADLLARHERMCWWLAKRCAPNARPADLEDVAAEVRLQFVRAARTFDPAGGANFGTYACRVAAHKARRYAARNGYGYALADGVTVLSLDAQLPNGRTLAEEVADRVPCEQARYPAAALDAAGLTREERVALAHRFADGGGFAAAAKALGCSPARARAVVNAALNKLRAAGIRFATSSEGGGR